MEARAREQGSAGGHCCCRVVIRSAVGQPVVEASVMPVVVDSGFVGQKEPFHGRNHAFADFAVWRRVLLRQQEGCRGNLHEHTLPTGIIAGFGFGLVR